MTEKEFEKYCELHDKFERDVERVTNHLMKIDKDLAYTDHFWLDEGCVCTEGWERWSYGGEEHHRGRFDAQMLTWSDEKLKKYVDDELEKRRMFAIEKAELTAKQKEEEERREYERLKEKYDK